MKNEIKVLGVRLLIVVAIVLIMFPLLGLFTGAIDHYGTIQNKRVISSTRYYSEVDFPLSLYHQDIFVNMFIALHSKDVKIYDESRSLEYPDCVLTIKELKVDKITYWTILNRSDECAR